jgi:CHAT domain-containing protein/Tfp pilus assembly protein PilF
MIKNERQILELAENNNNPEDFINELEKTVKSQKKKGDVFLYAGITLFNYSYTHLALSSWIQALAFFKKNGNKMREAMCLANLGLGYSLLPDFDRAINYYKKASQIFHKIGEISNESKCYTCIADAQYDLYDFKKAINYYEKSLKIASRKYRKAKCYNGLGCTYENLGNYRRALKFYEKALLIKKECRDPPGKLLCYINIASAHLHLGNYAKALLFYDKVLKSRFNQKFSLSATCYLGIGSVYIGLGNFKKGFEKYQKALEIHKNSDNKFGTSKVYLNLGNAHNSFGDFRKAIEYYEKALEIMQSINDRLSEPKCYNGLGSAYDSLGDFESSINYHNKALTLFQASGNDSGEAGCLMNIGSAYRCISENEKDDEKRKNNIDNAQKNFKMALIKMRSSGNRLGESQCYLNLGSTYFNLRDLEEAKCYYKKSLKMAKDLKDGIGKSKCYSGLGLVYKELGDLQKAKKYFGDSLLISKRGGLLEEERSSTLFLGGIYYDSNPLLSLKFLDRSISLSELISENLIEENHKVKFNDQVSCAYQNIIPLCLRLGKTKEAYNYLERSKSRAFLSSLANTKIKPVVQMTSDLNQLLDKEELCLAAVRQIQMRHLEKTSRVINIGQVDVLLENLNEVYDKLWKLDPQYVSARRIKPLNMKEIIDVVSSQKHSSVLVEYFHTADQLTIFVIAGEKKVNVKTLTFEREKFERCIRDYKKEVVSSTGNRLYEGDWLDLSDYLIKPIEEFLEGHDLIYFVPYSELHYLPLHALRLNEKPIIENHPVAYSQNASLLRILANKGCGKVQSCASFGIPNIRDSWITKQIILETAKSVAEVFGTQPMINSNATKAHVLAQCKDKDVIHFSCHGVYDPSDPLASHLILFDDNLTAKEVFDLRLNSEIVTLAGCETGRSKNVLGDELFGLPRAFLYAGAPSVIASLWEVYSEPTNILMSEFYTALKKGADKATALQEAQKITMREYPDPCCWAPFVLIGKYW